MRAFDKFVLQKRQVLQVVHAHDLILLLLGLDNLDLNHRGRLDDRILDGDARQRRQILIHPLLFATR